MNIVDMILWEKNNQLIKLLSPPKEKQSEEETKYEDDSDFSEERDCWNNF